MRVLAAILFMVAHFSADACEPVQPRKDIQSLDRGVVLEVWELANTDSLWASATSFSPYMREYRQWVQSLTNTDAYELLKRQKSFFDGFNPIIENFDLVIEGKFGEIGEISCLESELLSTHTMRFPLTEKPTEFSAFIFTKDEKIKIYFMSWDDDLMGAPPSGFVSEEISQSLNSGWRMLAHLHNHPFNFNNPTGDISGTIIPSSDGFKFGDVHYLKSKAKEWGLEQGWITNGFHSIRFGVDELELMN